VPVTLVLLQCTAACVCTPDSTPSSGYADYEDAVELHPDNQALHDDLATIADHL